MRRVLGKIVPGFGYVRPGDPGFDGEPVEDVTGGVVKDYTLESNGLRPWHPDAPRHNPVTGQAQFTSKKEQDEFKAKTGAATYEGGIAQEHVQAVRKEKRDSKNLVSSREKTAEFLIRAR